MSFIDALPAPKRSEPRAQGPLPASVLPKEKAETSTKAKESWKEAASKAGGVLRTTDDLGELRTDQLLKVHPSELINDKAGHGRIVYYKQSDTQEKDIPDRASIPIPSDAEVADSLKETQGLLDKLLTERSTALNAISAVQKVISDATEASHDAVVQFTPDGHDETKVIRMTSAKIDPMAPVKTDRNATTLPKTTMVAAKNSVPLLHEAHRKVTKEEQATWQVPSSVSSYKNKKGILIPLEQRTAARNLGADAERAEQADRRESAADRFADFNEALGAAERQARQDIAMRAQLRKEERLREEEARQRELERIAQQQTRDRGLNEQRKQILESRPSDASRGRPLSLAERERLRREESDTGRGRPRLHHQNNEREQDEEEDVDPEVEVDDRVARKGNRLQRGFDQDEHDLYDEPLFKGGSAATQSIYRPRKKSAGNNDDDALESLVHDQSGVGAGATQSRGASGPIEFEPARDHEQLRDEDESARYNPEDGMSRRIRALNNIGKRGTMHATSSGGGVFDGAKSKDVARAMGQSGRTIGFSNASSSSHRGRDEDEDRQYERDDRKRHKR
eukprot:Clim_evm35s142 gene=Clim_evmTU35s142